MIGFWRGALGDEPPEPGRVAASLGIFARFPADFYSHDSSTFWELDGPRPTRRRPGWRPWLACDGSCVLFHGWIDNDDDLAEQTGLARGNPAAIYGALVARWGRAADTRIHGHYCAIVARPDGSVRLSRSPWTATPLVYAASESAVMAASVPRALFAAGLSEKINPGRVADSLMINFRQDEESWFEGVKRVPQGSIVECLPSLRVDRWYDPVALTPVRFARDEDYVDGANRLLAEAVAKALRTSACPGIKLSGGLDSPIVAAEMLRQLPPNQRLPSFTFVPRADWDGIVPPDLMGDESEFVKAFAQMQPRLDTHYTDNFDAGFDSLEREFFLAMGGAPSHLPNYPVYHDIWRAARDAGCDWLFHAELGNGCFSAHGAWSYREDLVHGHWHQLYLTLKHRRGDPRPLWRKTLALSVLPLFPAPVLRAVRRLAHSRRGEAHQVNTVLREEAVERLGLIQRQGSDAKFRARTHFTDQAEFIENVYHACDIEGSEIWQGFEQIFGLRQRDIVAYRPLIEFCLGMPTRQFVSHGQERWLAKRMAIGKMPEAQRLNPRFGRHNVDWHARMTPRRAELAAEAERLRDHPMLGELIDIDRVQHLLADWPVVSPWDPEEAYPRQVGITRAIQAARFVDFVEGRNTL